MWEIYIKKCIRSLLKSSLSVDYVPVYICKRVLYYITIFFDVWFLIRFFFFSEFVPDVVVYLCWDENFDIFCCFYSIFGWVCLILDWNDGSRLCFALEIGSGFILEIGWWWIGDFCGFSLRVIILDGDLNFSVDFLLRRKSSIIGIVFFGFDCFLLRVVFFYLFLKFGPFIFIQVAQVFDESSVLSWFKVVTAD